MDKDFVLVLNKSSTGKFPVVPDGEYKDGKSGIVLPDMGAAQLTEKCWSVRLIGSEGFTRGTRIYLKLQNGWVAHRTNVVVGGYSIQTSFCLVDGVSEQVDYIDAKHGGYMEMDVLWSTPPAGDDWSLSLKFSRK